MRLIERLNLEIHEASRIIYSEALKDENARLLMTIPGGLVLLGFAADK